MAKSSAFRGPLFIVGLSRSGTTLIRDLLNRNDRVNLPIGESHFVPMLVQRFGASPRLEDKGVRQAVVRLIMKSTYVTLQAGRGQPIDRDQLLDTVQADTWENFLEFLFRECAEEPGRSDTIWGDKTPQYLVHMGLLKRICPDARFLHIIRDVRDRCISVRNIWRKNLFRGAVQWADQIRQSRGYQAAFGRDYFEIRYEKLLEDPPAVLQQVCECLGIEYQDQMTQLKRPVQRYGDARGRAEIVQDNTGKYMDRITKRELRRIEEIAFPMMQEVGYEPVLADSHRPVGRCHLRFLILRDRWFHFRFNLRQYGFWNGMHRAYWMFITDTWFGKRQSGDT